MDFSAIITGVTITAITTLLGLLIKANSILNNIYKSNKRNSEKIALLLIGTRLHTRAHLITFQVIQDGEKNGNIKIAEKELQDFEAKVYNHIVGEDK